MANTYIETLYQLTSYFLEFFVTSVYYLFTLKVRNLNKHKSVVVITGCDSGFGNALSLELSQQGYHVISVCLTENGIHSLKGKVARTVSCDVSKDEDVNKLANEVEKYVLQDGLHLWAVINNAGISPVGYTDWMDIAQFERIHDVNYMGPIRVTKALLPLLKKTKYSRIVNLSSIFGLIGWPGYAAYCGPKHALEGAMKCMRMELRPWNIRVFNVNPSFMATPLVPASIDSFKKHYQQAPSEIKQQYSGEYMMKTADLISALQENPKMVVRAVSNLMVSYNPSFNHYVGVFAQICKLWLLLPQTFRERFDFLLPSPISPKQDVVNRLQGMAAQ